ncbi:SHOCT domain-containing protein [Microterricola viridarii]|uniref:Phospholipase_D-nuclease N-terminal n=1 Tax=Microterricola viridarii TaxID=412690 RepID=A0A1H1WC77_9MICO|nr:SHOCT domain-containing protein [Microterricola viridarii]SDS94270.1 Phospholipase_D-nuclease N-terminal [Microterricola viridarii]
MSFWDYLIWLFWVYITIACIWIFITVIIDMFRDHTLNGWQKALWALFLVFLPFLATFVYLIARGKSMSERRMDDYRHAQRQTDEYIREVASSSPAVEIEKAKQLLDAGAITQPEFDALKAKALAAS